MNISSDNRFAPPPDLDHAGYGYDYAAETYSNRHWIIRYPHEQRLHNALKVVESLRPRRMLDYGAGDAHLEVELLGRRASAEIGIVAYEPAADFFDIAQERLSRVAGGERVQCVKDLREAGEETFDFVSCISVLEHLTMFERTRFYDFCERSIRPGGHVLVVVPVETGLTLLVKQGARVLLKGRKQEYGLRELLRAVACRPIPDEPRLDPTNRSPYIGDHRGFDFRQLQKELEQRFTLERRFGTPFKSLPPDFANQEVMFLLRCR